MSSNLPKHLVIVIRGLSRGGVSRAIHHWMDALDNSRYSSQMKITILTNESNFREKQYSNISVDYLGTSSKLLFDWYASLRALLRLKPDSVLYTKNVIPITHGLIPAKKSIIVYDLGYFEKGLGAYKPLDTLFMRTFMKISASWSHRVFTISDFTKSRVETLFGIPQEKIITAHLSLEKTFTTTATESEKSQTLKNLDLQTPFIFYAGSISPRKNLVRLIKAFLHVSQNLPHHLYITGLKSWGDKNELAQLVEEHKDKIHILGYVEDADLKSLYSLADAYVFPSLYEGFGLPILEAQSQGTPVITSNGNSCIEVAEESAEIVDPSSVDMIAQSIVKVLTDDKYSKELSHKGFENLKRFSWDTSIETIIENLSK